MELVTWFGRVDPDSACFVPAGDLDQMAEKLMHPIPSLAGGQPDLRGLAKSCNFVIGDEEYNRRLREVALELVKRELKSRDTVEAEALQMIEALDDLDHAINLLDERLFEWSLLHGDEPQRNEDQVMPPAGRGPAGELATAITDLRGSRQRIEEALSSSISTFAPNLSSLAGPLLAARLISRAGSLRRLSELPSSTIQVCGAEKSLFKHLNGKAPSPKHGLIYRHPAIMNAPKRLRGRLARALSGKLAIAARIDYHSNVMSPELKKSLEDRLAEIKRTGPRAKSSRKNL